MLNNAKEILSHIIDGECDSRVVSAAYAIAGSLLKNNSECCERIIRLANVCETAEDYSNKDLMALKKPILLKNYFKGGAAIAAFNMCSSQNTVYGSVRAIDAGLKNKGGYSYYEYFSGDFGYVNADEDIYFTLDKDFPTRYFVFLRKTENKPLFLGRTDLINGNLAITDQSEDTVYISEGGNFAFVCDDDYAILNSAGMELEYDRFGLVCTSYCDKDNLSIKFIRDDY